MLVAGLARRSNTSPAAPLAYALRRRRAQSIMSAASPSVAEAGSRLRIGSYGPIATPRRDARERLYFLRRRAARAASARRLSVLVAGLARRSNTSPAAPLAYALRRRRAQSIMSAAKPSVAEAGSGTFRPAMVMTRLPTLAPVPAA